MLPGGTDAKDSLSKLASNVSTWWANLDPVPKPVPTSPSGHSTIPAHHQQARSAYPLGQRSMVAALCHPF